MKMNFEGKAWVFGDSVNTDLMYPHICYTVPDDEKHLYTMWANRPDWARMVKKGDILVAGKSFGIGSSRPAAANLKALGLACVLAESVNGLFLRNSVNFGFLTISCPGITGIVKEGDILSVDIARGRVENIASGRNLEFKPLPNFLMEIIEEGGIIEVLKKRGYLEDEPL